MTQTTLDTIAKLIFGGLLTTGLFALVIWFLTRYINQRDDFEKGIEKKIADIPAKIANSITDIKEVVHELKTQQLELTQNMRSHRLQNLETQKRISEELLKIEKHITIIEGTLDRTKEKADKLDSNIEKMSERVMFHDKAMSNIIDWAKKTKQQLDTLSTDYQTTKKVLSDDLIMLKTKKTK